MMLTPTGGSGSKHTCSRGSRMTSRPFGCCSMSLMDPAKEVGQEQKQEQEPEPEEQ